MQQLLARIASQYRSQRRMSDPDPVAPSEILNTTSGAMLLMDGSLVVKLHRQGTDGRRLAQRLRLSLAAANCLLVPLTLEPIAVQVGKGEDRWVSIWPRIEPVAQNPETAPWAEAAALLARLHRTALPQGPDARLEHGAVRRLHRALTHLDGVRTAAADVVRAAAARLPPEALVTSPHGRPRCLTHGDWHLGQIGRERDAAWVLFDLDDLGVGDPVWDLARPAGFAAAGLLPDVDWRAFLDGYRAAGGPAVPEGGDPWPALDAIARAAVVQTAAAGLSRASQSGAEPDEIDQLLVEACDRMS